MGEVNIITLLKHYSMEIVISAIIGCLIAIIIYKLIKPSNKILFLISFAISSIISIAIYFISGSIDEGFITNGITAGALSITLSAFVKKLAFISDEDIKKSLEKLISSVAVSDNLDKVVEEIIDKLKDTTLTKSELKTFIKDSVNDVDDDKLNSVCDFIFKAIGCEDKEELDSVSNGSNVGENSVEESNESAQTSDKGDLVDDKKLNE